MGIDIDRRLVIELFMSSHSRCALLQISVGGGVSDGVRQTIILQGTWVNDTKEASVPGFTWRKQHYLGKQRTNNHLNHTPLPTESTTNLSSSKFLRIINSNTSANMGSLTKVPGSVRSYLDMYGDFITKNAGAVSQIESALRSLTYIVPGVPPSPVNSAHPHPLSLAQRFN